MDQRKKHLPLPELNRSAVENISQHTTNDITSNNCVDEIVKSERVIQNIRPEMKPKLPCMKLYIPTTKTQNTKHKYRP